MKEEEARAIFVLADIKIISAKALVDGYGYPPGDPRHFETPPRQVWWFVKTKAGWIEIGWRKRVINIDWTDTAIVAHVTTDSTTKDKHMVHAWSVEDAIKYLKALAPFIEAQAG